ncbi:head GIN domain-containing protein [Adhaeribacter soli]|uniref:DUF2807 domain-containing protein n=1 Tax=Adhaeribacter soli TaxID=2607655 RepID=A0A5N1J9T5_9BACT|nr:head GIN domain-containing protein [Adhaeribacter soli]KAA9345768.1 DUF2807 domain-containing protein [Adhaeribacter soli]
MDFRKLFAFSYLFATVSLGGCQKENAFDCLKSTGRIVTETRPLSSFRTIKVFDNLKVTIVADTVHYAEVKAGDNLQKNILTEVKDGELWLSNINKCNWVRSYHKPLEVRVHVKSLLNVFHDGEATVSSENTLPADTIFLHLTGAGDLDLTLNSTSVWLDMYEYGNISLKGANQHLNGYVMSLGKLEAAELKCQTVSLQMGGNGYAKVQASVRLSANIESNGNVYYLNQPAEIYRSGEGKGKILKAN